MAAKGVDISENNGKVDFAQLKIAGIDLCFFAVVMEAIMRTRTMEGSWKMSQRRKRQECLTASISIRMP